MDYIVHPGTGTIMASTECVRVPVDALDGIDPDDLLELQDTLDKYGVPMDTTIDPMYANKNQSLEVSMVDNNHVPKLRAKVRRNAYDHQSWGNVSAWSEGGWQVIETWPIETFGISTHSAFTQNTIWQDAGRLDCERLLDWAREFFGGTQ